MPGPDGEVCFDDARAQVGAGYERVQPTWSFGDGAAESGTTNPCHTYGDPTASHTARLSMVVRFADGTVSQLWDEVQVG